MLNNPRSTERDNQNALRKFPFSDASSCSNGACVIPPGAVIDAQLYVPGREPGRVWLSRIDGSGVLHFSDDAGEFAKLSQPPAADSAVPVTFTGDGGPLPGGVMVFGHEADVSALRRLAGQTFTVQQTELAPAAISWPGLPGVCGFKLDDGHVVYGDVQIRGANGCEVSTYKAERRSRLRISAVGRKVETGTTTGFITRVVAESDNVHFVVHKPDDTEHVIEITLTGAATLQDDWLNADQENLCSQARTRTGMASQTRAAALLGCAQGACSDIDTATYTVTLNNEDGSLIASFLRMRGVPLGDLLSTQIPADTDTRRFAGYFDSYPGDTGRVTGDTVKMYYRHDGTGIGNFTPSHDVTLYAYFMDKESRAAADFTDGYGTLHLNAPSVNTYTNPLRIYGTENPIPSVHEHTEAMLAAGGTDALAELVLRPDVPVGEVHISLRGASKMSLL